MSNEPIFANKDLTLDDIIVSNQCGGKAAVQSYLSSRRRQMIRQLASFDVDSDEYIHCIEFTTGLAEAAKLLDELTFDSKASKK